MYLKSLFFCTLFAQCAMSQDVSVLVEKLKIKLDQVKNYTAEGRLKTDVAFMKIPVSDVNVYFKTPDRFKVVRKNGISLLPKGGVSVNLNTLLADHNFLAIPAGEAKVGDVSTKIVKLLPQDENSDVILATLYIDEKELLIRKATTTTRENGTYDVALSYGKYATWGLPDKVVFTFNTRDYKIPKGVTFEYDTGEKPLKKDDVVRNKIGKVEITYQSYKINGELPDSVFN